MEWYNVIGIVKFNNNLIQGYTIINLHKEILNSNFLSILEFILWKQHNFLLKILISMKNLLTFFKKN